MKVRMKVALSGTHNGVEWPAVGTVIDLPDAEAAGYCAAGLAETADPAGTVQAAVVDEPTETATVNTAPRRRGRPPGSKNKPKPGTGPWGSSP